MSYLKVVLVALGGILVVAMLAGSPLVAQGRGIALHRQVNYEEGSIRAFCDEGNGTMLYIVEQRYSNKAVGVAAVPNGCSGSR